jgi:hypothetical protein
VPGYQWLEEIIDMLIFHCDEFLIFKGLSERGEITGQEIGMSRKKYFISYETYSICSSDSSTYIGSETNSDEHLSAIGKRPAAEFIKRKALCKWIGRG